jgi:hypothetical protein
LSLQLHKLLVWPLGQEPAQPDLQAHILELRARLPAQELPIARPGPIPRAEGTRPAYKACDDPHIRLAVRGWLLLTIDHCSQY